MNVVLINNSNNDGHGGGIGLRNDDPLLGRKTLDTVAVSSPRFVVERNNREEPSRGGGGKKKKKCKRAKNIHRAAPKPKAGSTSVRIENPSDLALDEDGNPVAGWRRVDPSTVRVRGTAYSSSSSSSSWKKRNINKNKVGSPGELYRCVKADVFESERRYPDMASRVRLPRVEFDDDDDDEGGGPKTWVAPDLFVISVSLPTDPSAKKSESHDGPGYTVTMYYAMQQETRDILRKITSSGGEMTRGGDIDVDDDDDGKTSDPDKSKVNAVRLLERWCREAPTDDTMMSRFKVLPRADNLEAIGLPSWISKLNGKPFLVKRPGTTGFLYSHPRKSCMEFDVSLHPFPFLAKKAIRCMRDSHFAKTIATLAFCLEGRDEDELPECLLGAFQLCYPDPAHAIRGEDFFGGKVK